MNKIVNRTSSVMVLASLVLFPACWHQDTEHVVVQEAFMTQPVEGSDIDSVAIWHGPQEQHWLIATAKGTDNLFIYNAADGSLVSTFGGPGTGNGEFKRPNGIAVQDDLLFVVERDNKRLQILHLPSMRICGMTVGDLERPYGLAVVSSGRNIYDVYVTDNPGSKQVITAKKIYHYRVERAAGGCSIQLVRTFGDETGLGALWKVESIAADPAYNRLFIADEHAERKNIKIYTLDGQFTGMTLGDGLIKSEPEGIVLYALDDVDGYIIATDQDRQENVFYIFDRVTLELKGSFMGAQVRNTDGIACTTTSFGLFKQGVLYAVHDDGGIGAFDWKTITDKVIMRDVSADTVCKK